jgi:hypothetical protein
MRSLQMLCLETLMVSGRWLTPNNHVNHIIPPNLLPSRQLFEFDGFYGEITICVSFESSSLLDHVKLINDINAAMKQVDANLWSDYCPIIITTKFPKEYYFWFWKIFERNMYSPSDLCSELTKQIKGLEGAIRLIRWRKLLRRRLVQPRT